MRKIVNTILNRKINYQIISHLIVAALRGNAGAGGAMLALAADQRSKGVAR